FGSAVIPYSDPAGQGNQSYSGNLALKFNVNSPVAILELGVFDANVADGTGTSYSSSNTQKSQKYGAGLSDTNSLAKTSTGGTTSITVGIYNTVTGKLITSATFTSSNSYTLVGDDLFQSVTPIMLAPGSYEIDAVGFN